METFIEQITQLTGSYVPRIVAALAVLILGWFIALVITTIVRSVLNRTTLDDFALCFERETLINYYTLRGTIKEKDIIDSIIREEKSHIVWLNNLRRII